MSSKEIHAVEDASATAVLEPELPELEKVCRTFSKPQSPRAEDTIRGEIAQHLAEIQRLKEVCDAACGLLQSEISETSQRAARAVQDMLAIEEHLKNSINKRRDDKISELQMRISEATIARDKAILAVNDKIKVLQTELRVRDIDLKFPRIDMSFLRQMRPADTNGVSLPKFAMYALTSGQCVISATADSSGTTCSSSPPVYMNLADTQTLQSLATSKRGYSIRSLTVKASANFTGAIPQPIRLLLADVTKTFEEVYVINEPEWTVEEVIVPFQPPYDPLVIGFKDGISWLIASFDTTPAEEYIRREFTQGELKDIRG